MTQIRTWLAAWDLSPPVQVHRVDGGFTSHVWRVESGGRRYVAKLAYQPRDDFENGLRAAAVLSRHGLRTGPARQTRSGDLTLSVEYPPGSHHSLALLEYVGGEPLDWRTPEALRVAGGTLGTVHRTLLADGSLGLGDQLFGYLQHDAAWGAHPELQPLVDRAIDAVRGFEASRGVTYGPIYGDGLQLRLDPRDGRVGIIDWGTVSYGPWLFDLALAAHSLRSAGHDDLTQLWSSYLEVAPLDPSELDGLAMYTALMWARSAKYFAYRLEHRVELGDPSPDANARALAGAIAALEQLVS